MVDAVACAVAAQKQLGEANTAVRRRRPCGSGIGVHGGDVIVKAGNLLGDGTNVAARVQALADPGGVWLSARAHEEVKGKLELWVIIENFSIGRAWSASLHADLAQASGVRPRHAHATDAKERGPSGCPAS